MLILLRLIVGFFCQWVLVVSSMGVLLGGLIMLIGLFGLLCGSGSAFGFGGILFIFSALLAERSGNAAKECFEFEGGDVKSEVFAIASTVKRFFTMSVWQVGIAVSFILFAIGLIWSLF